MKTGPGRHTGPTAEGGEVTTDRERSQHVPITKPEKSGALPNPKRSTTETAKTKRRKTEATDRKNKSPKGRSPTGDAKPHKGQKTANETRQKMDRAIKDMQDAEEP